VTEGTAVWATEQFDSTLDDFEGFVPGYLSQIDRTLNLPGSGPVDSFSYGAALFFQFLGEKYGVDIVRKLYEDCVPGARGVAAPDWFTALDPLLAREYGTTFADAFTTFSTWNLFTASRADPSRAYASSVAYLGLKPVKSALPYEDATLRVFRSSTQVLSIDPAGRTSLDFAVLPLDGQTADTLAPLRLVVAPVTNSTIGTIGTPALKGASSLDVGGATQILVELVNTAQSGESVRGTLCIGDPTEVLDCRARHGDVVMTTPPDKGCAFVAGRTSSSAPLLLGLFCVVLLRRRRAIAR
jgi:hypothetical protein